MGPGMLVLLGVIVLIAVVAIGISLINKFAE
jgi:hypothetical protein